MDKRIASRRNKNKLTYPERRTGFDRRAAGKTGLVRLAAGLADHRRAFLNVLLAVNILSVLDFALTMNLINFGSISEGNPLMAVLILLNPLAALAFKISLVLVITLVFWRFRRYRSIVLAAASTLALFTGLVCYQLTLLVLLPGI